MFDRPIVLDPGASGTSTGVRADWSPYATPAAHDVYAHTPDPTKYFANGGRVQLPRASALPNAGASLGFSTAPGQVTLDPEFDGTTIDLSQVRPEATRLAASASHDPVQALKTAATASNMLPKIATSPIQPTGTTVPSTLPQVDMAAVMAQFGQMAVPTGAGPAPAPAPPPAAPSAPPPPPGAGLDMQQLMQVLQTLANKVAAPAASPPVATPAVPAAVAPVYSMPAYPTTPVAAPTALAPLPPLPSPQADPRPPAMDATQRLLKELDLEFVGVPEATRPQIAVTFDLGRGGRHLIRFHAVRRRGSWLSLFYDTRYDGNQFVPPNTSGDDGEHQPVYVASDSINNGQPVRVVVQDDFHFDLGCISILNLLVEA